MEKWMAWVILAALVLTGAIFTLIGAAFEIAHTLCIAFMAPIKAGAAGAGLYGTLLVIIAADAIGTAAATLALTLVGLDVLPALVSSATLVLLIDILAFVAC